MSDYFGALLRSAGAVPADTVTRATPTSGADLVEQDLEVEVGAAPHPVAAAPSLAAPAGIEPAPHAPIEAAPASPARREPMRSEPVKSPLAPSIVDDEVHPIVRAALRWVAADPGPVDRVVPGVPEALPLASDPLPRQQPHPATASARASRPVTSAVDAPAAATEPTRTVRPPQTPLSLRIEREAETAPERKAAAPPQPWLVRDLDLTPRASHARQTVVTTIDDAAPAPQERIEVSIGTIHVRVDAPSAPQAVVQPAPPPQRPPQSTRPADRSSFARSRVPRI